mmetsp:Transcript_56796/g.143926  ORF Transcript_56796/g.143926 Transcript_56796/m.143926 type:complete len:237 (+) Transcript_56796:1405-2115(+)
MARTGAETLEVTRIRRRVAQPKAGLEEDEEAFTFIKHTWRVAPLPDPIFAHAHVHAIPVLAPPDSVAAPAFRLAEQVQSLTRRALPPQLAFFVSPHVLLRSRAVAGSLRLRNRLRERRPVRTLPRLPEVLRLPEDMNLQTVQGHVEFLEADRTPRLFCLGVEDWVQGLLAVLPENDSASLPAFLFVLDDLSAEGAIGRPNVILHPLALNISLAKQQAVLHELQHALQLLPERHNIE